MAYPALLYADPEGRTLDEPQLIATGRSWDQTYALTPDDLIPLPEGATLCQLPGRPAVGQDPATGELLELSLEEPGEDGAEVEGKTPVPELSAVAALLPQGYTRLHLPGYAEPGEPGDGTAGRRPVLPFFGYTAVAWYKGAFHVAARRTDSPEAVDRWNPVHFNRRALPALIGAMEEEFPGNRLVKHLARCATEYHCFTAQNLFYRRWEAGIPVSPACNAGCKGCLSLQPDDGPVTSPQERIAFTPAPEEVAELAVPHLEQAQDAIVSFGQGCEGEPSLAVEVLAPAIRLIRERTQKGTINLNTNAGWTAAIERLIDAGLDSMRVSLISARPEIYDAYHCPAGYGLSEVAASIRGARRAGVFVSLNLLVFPGLTDRPEEVAALKDFIRANGINLVQLRNLNIDPDSLVRLLPGPEAEPLGLARLIEELHSLPGVEVGNSSRPVGRRVAP